ncbi:MAG TPA: DUF2282 domain-containing protein [Leucothrix sp.]|nr:DUF2282 domain-containing protein [Leucothrix sp.]
MSNSTNIIKTALTGIMATGLLTVTSSAMAGKPGMEKCMGVAAAGKNDCGTSQHACAGQSKTDGDTEEWVYVKEGTCEKLAGGKIKVGKAKMK